MTMLVALLGPALWAAHARLTFDGQHQQTMAIARRDIDLWLRTIEVRGIDVHLSDYLGLASNDE